MTKVVFNRFVGLLLAGAAVMTSCKKEGSSPSTLTTVENQNITSGDSAMISGKVFAPLTFNAYTYKTLASTNPINSTKDTTSESDDWGGFIDGSEPTMLTDWQAAEGMMITAEFDSRQQYSASGTPTEVPARTVLTTTVDANGDYSFAIPTGSTSDGIDVTLTFESKAVNVTYPTFSTVNHFESAVKAFVADSTTNGVSGNAEYVYKTVNTLVTKRRVMNEQTVTYKLFGNQSKVHDVEYSFDELGGGASDHVRDVVFEQLGQ